MDINNNNNKIIKIQSFNRPFSKQIIIIHNDNI